MTIFAGRRKFKAILGGESGQAAVLTALLAAVLLFFVAATTNIGKVVTEKIAMQNAVDMAAYAGAATEAGYFNQIRAVNQDTWQTIYNARDLWSDSDTAYIGRTGTFIWDGVDCPTGPMRDGLTVSLQEEEWWQAQWVLKVTTNNNKAQMLNNKALASASQAAQQTADKNYSGTSGDVTALQGSSGPMIHSLQTKPINVSYRGWCYPPDSPTPVPWPFRTTKELDSWSYKQDPGDVVFAAQIKGAVPDSPFVDIPGNYFSGPCKYGETQSNGRCSLDVYAVAQPFYGKLGSNLNRQVGSWENLQNYIDEPDIQVLDPKGQLTASEVIGGQHYNDYGTRFIGIFENVTVSGQSSLTSLVPNGTMMRH